ncbi:MAG: glycosyltransferase family 4 protein [Bacteroidetes bacterium]|nr:glycosyltransferase family 4 protein [Bacteroidota bacterium]
MKILFLAPYPMQEAPSQRFRFEQYLQILKQHGFVYDFKSFFGSGEWKQMSLNGKGLIKIMKVLKGLAQRALLLTRVRQYDFVFIHREAAPVGPPIIEWILAKLLNKRLIYDFDDAIWTTDRPTEPLWFRVIKWRNKVSSICRWSHRISAGNQFLAQYASQFNSSVVINPSTIDMQNAPLPATRMLTSGTPPTIGWTGSHTTIKYLKSLESVLRSLLTHYSDVHLVIISDTKPQLQIPNLRFIPWSREREIQDLGLIDIGIMPLPDDEWARGKCGFKALQYMSLGKPAVVSPVGVNTTLVEQGVNGFLCNSDNEWYHYLDLLIRDEQLRAKLGMNGRSKVMRFYSVGANTENFLRLFE